MVFPHCYPTYILILFISHHPRVGFLVGSACLIRKRGSSTMTPVITTAAAVASSTWPAPAPPAYREVPYREIINEEEEEEGEREGGDGREEEEEGEEEGEENPQKTAQRQPGGLWGGFSNNWLLGGGGGGGRPFATLIPDHEDGDDRDLEQGWPSEAHAVQERGDSSRPPVPDNRMHRSTEHTVLLAATTTTTEATLALAQQQQQNLPQPSYSRWCPVLTAVSTTFTCATILTVFLLTVESSTPYVTDSILGFAAAAFAAAAWMTWEKRGAGREALMAAVILLLVGCGMVMAVLVGGGAGAGAGAGTGQVHDGG